MASPYNQLQRRLKELLSGDLSRLKNYLVLTGFRLLQVITGLMKDMVLTRHLGLGAFVDAYFISTSYLDVFAGYFQQMGYGVLLPLYNKTSQESDSEQEAATRQQKLIVVFMNYALLSMGLMALVMLVLHQTLGAWVAPKLANTKYLDLFFFLALPVSMLFQGSYALRLVLVQQKRFGYYYFPNIVSAFVFAVGVYALYPALGYRSVLWVLPLSQIVQFVMYWQVLGIRWRWLWQHESLREMIRYALPTTFIILIYYLLVPIDNYFLALLPAGELSAFRYASKIANLISTVSVFGLQMTLVPQLMTLGSQRNLLGMRKLVNKGMLESFLYSLPLILGMLFGSSFLIQLLFQRGAFHAHDTRLVSDCLNILILQLPYLGAWMLVSRSFNSLTMFKPFLFLGVLTVLLRGLFDWVGMTRWGVEGIAWMSTVHYYVMLVLGVWLLYAAMRQESIAETA